MRNKILSIILLFTVCTAAQDNKVPEFIGSFENACSFSISTAGYIFVCDAESNEIIKMDLAGKIIKSIGGFGWAQSAFDEPSDVFATVLRIFVTDKNNNRIQVFDKDLNFLFEVKSQSGNSGFSFAYPLSCVTSPQGDLYILDSDNLRVLKYNLSGEFQFQIGGNDAGIFSLRNPTHLAVAHDGKIFAVDNNLIFVYDQYGFGLVKINPEMNNLTINILLNILCISDESSVKILDLSKQDSNFRLFVPQLEPGEKIVEASVFENYLYILTPERILRYKLESIGF